MWKASIATLLVLACSRKDSAGPLAKVEDTGRFELHCAAFPNEGAIPKKFTGDGPDVSPALRWTGAPAGTKALALIVDDPDAPMGTWVHWVVYDLAPTETSLPEGVPKGATLAGGARQGKNSWGDQGYGGPAPPPGDPHRYYFKLYALSEPTRLGPGATKQKVLAAMQGKKLGEAQWMGRYGRTAAPPSPE